MEINQENAKGIWTALTAAVGFLFGFAGAVTSAFKVKLDIRTLKNAVLDDKGKPNVMTISDCKSQIEKCGGQRTERRKESREDLQRELQNIHAAITAQNVQFKTIAEEVAAQGQILNLIKENIYFGIRPK
ncbi:MAG: hypothetical protein ACU83N_09975 [Gammaproteobacteria bacterium]